MLLAWTPYLLVALALLVTRWPDLTVAGVAVLDWIQSFSVGLDSILGTELGYTLQYLYLPGTMPFIPIAILTGFLHKMDTTQMGKRGDGRSSRSLRPPSRSLSPSR